MFIQRKSNFNIVSATPKREKKSTLAPSLRIESDLFIRVRNTIQQVKYS